MELGAALSENFPSKSVTVPVVVPFTNTETPIIGSPVSSTIVPVTVLFWATIWESDTLPPQWIFSHCRKSHRHHGCRKSPNKESTSLCAYKKAHGSLVFFHVFRLTICVILMIAFLPYIRVIIEILFLFYSSKFFFI